MFPRPLESAQGEALAQRELAHSVHPQVTGLEPATEYFYRFRVDGKVSPVGRFKTLPAPGAKVDDFTFTVASCQAWYHGYFTPWKHIAQEPDLDMTIFVGDYIYEYGIVEGNNLWRQGASVPDVFKAKVETLEQYRLRYSLFKSDEHLRAAHARAAMAIVWDDHEVENNYAGNWSEIGTKAEHFLYQRAAAYRAFYENLPVAPPALPEGPNNRIYDSFDVGTLMRFNLVDTRQYREESAEDASILGAEQEQWLNDRLATSPAQWNVVVNSVVVVPIADSTDQWDGFPTARRRLIESLSKVSDPVVFTGDIHQHCAAEIQSESGQPVGVELVATSIASDGDGFAGSKSTEWLEKPYVKAMDKRRGYIKVRATGEHLDSEFVVVPWIERDDTAPRETAFSFRTNAGEHTLRSL
ncbi:alkaline phosphatase D family protein [Corynebacterium kefirresidentii]|uniref:alkaline phosphatase D family protein n=1 Tax=Corynebacterium TaxID=1716 RepID=UPI001EF2585D|nr:alkaline phosphatase D family protein [Corynebacterium kefirresidentii]MCG7450666.1 alkaline phosphatase D family protein [Corynebacterium kefirresidentii]MCG7453008.1 alkaline phosphatase D family protein [Corynebacterium kefirresidentii]